MVMRRLIKNVITTDLSVRRAFPPATLAEIESLVRESESKHNGQIRVAVEGGMPLSLLVKGRSARDRAVQLFAELGVWDTEQNCGVLIYLLMSERQIEIVADRGVSKVVTPERWLAICSLIEKNFKSSHYLEGVRDAIEATTEILAEHFPPHGPSPDELSNRPIML